MSGPRLPSHPLKVSSPRITNRGPVTTAYRWQVWHDGWRNLDRDLRWYGVCFTCGRNVWAFDDGENDPRGALGDNALWCATVQVEDGKAIPKEVEVRQCAICANEEGPYTKAVTAALIFLRDHSTSEAWERYGPHLWGMYEVSPERLGLHFRG